MEMHLHTRFQRADVVDIAHKIFLSRRFNWTHLGVKQIGNINTWYWVTYQSLISCANFPIIRDKLAQRGSFDQSLDSAFLMLHIFVSDNIVLYSEISFSGTL